MGLETVVKFWTEWQIQALTLLSLLLQVILVLSGSTRKVKTSKRINFLVWSAYLSADRVATFALGILARSFSEAYPNHSLQAFWAPFLVLHLGGPDTITAYSLEDNELWPRHLVGLIFQVGIAIFVFFRSWAESQSILCFVAIPVYIAGVIKYGERVWVLWSSSTKQFSKNLLKESEWRKLHERKNDDTDHVFFLFKKLKCLFAGSLLDPRLGKESRAIISSKKPSEAFELVQVELGLLYDVLYTKATILHSRFGMILRCITVLASVSAFITFSIVISSRRLLLHQSYSSVDISVTYLLLIGAVVLEVCALVSAAFSDWTEGYRKVTSNGKRRRWSRAIAQYNLMDDCYRKMKFKNDDKWKRITRSVQKLLGMEDQKVFWKQVDVHLQSSIFDHIKERTKIQPSILDSVKEILNVGSSDYLENSKLCRELLNFRGDLVLYQNHCLNEFKWCTTGTDFNHSLLIWHIATELCYYNDINIHPHSKSNIDKWSEISRCLSNYMLYLLFMCPHMLPNGIGLDKKARLDVIEGLKKYPDKKEACKNWFGTSRLQRNGFDIKNMFLNEEGNCLRTHGIMLASRLQAHGEILQFAPGYFSTQHKWEIMEHVWLELLTYASSHCGWKEHAQQLTKGGELLTHVCRLMAHFGLSQQYQVTPRLYKSHQQQA